MRTIKGFTLIELLAVITIFAIVAMISMPKIISIIDNVKEESYYRQIEMVEKTTNLYINNKIFKNKEIEEYITLGSLSAQGLIKEKIRDPRTNKELSGVLKVTKVNKKYVTEYLEVNSESGEVVLADVTKKIKNVIIEGTSEQTQTVQGKNMFDGLLETGQWSVSTGLKTSTDIKIRSANKIKVLPNTQYTIKNYTTDSNIYLLSYKKDDSFIKYEGTNVGVMTITTTAETSYLTFYINSDGSVNGQGSLNDLIQLELGSTASSYETFIPNSPTPSFPSAVNSGGNSNLVIGSCNLFDINTMSLTASSKNGDIISLNQLVYDRILTMQHWVPKMSTQYTIVVDIIENTFSTPLTLASDNRFYFNSASNSIPVGKLGRVVFNRTTRNDFSTVTIGSLWFQTTNTVTGVFKFKLTILEGNYTIDNLPENRTCKMPITTKITIPTLNKIGDVTDTYNPLTGEYVKRVGIKVLDGTETWEHNASPDKIFDDVNVFHLIDPLWQNQQGLSTHFVLNNQNNNTEHIRIGTGYLFMYIGKLKAADLNMFKNYLANQKNAGKPITIYYLLETPIITNLGVKVIPNDPNYIYTDSQYKGNIIVEYH